MLIKQIKRICLTKETENGQPLQFISSGYPNRQEDGKSFKAVDGMFIPDLIPDLEYNECDGKNGPEQGIECLIHMRMTPMKGFKKMWVFSADNGKDMPEFMTHYEPTKITRTAQSTKALIKNGCLRLDSWNSHTYFPARPKIFKKAVYIRVERLKPKQNGKLPTESPNDSAGK